MKNWRHYVTAAAGTALIMGVFSFSGAGAALAQQVKSTMTLITNGPDQPVPVKAVATVPVQQDDGSKTVFAEEVKLGWGGTVGYDCSQPIVVPAGKRIVLEYISVDTTLLSGDALFGVEVRSGVPFDNRIFATLQPVFGGTGGGGGPLYSAGQTVKLYMDNDFIMCGRKLTTQTPSFFSAMMWGYVVNRS